MKKIFYILLIVLMLVSAQVYADTYAISTISPDGIVKVTGSSGIVGITGIPVTLKNLYTTEYLVPDGYALYITNLKMSRENDALKIKPFIVACTIPISATVNGVGGALAEDTATWYYRVEYYSGYTKVASGYGETYVTAAILPTTDSISLSSIPVSQNATVTARKIYRSNDNSTYYLLTTIADNSTTTYTDSTNDTTLEAGTAYSAYTFRTFTIATGKVNGNQYGQGQMDGKLNNPIFLNHEDVLSASNNYLVVNGVLVATDNIFITAGNLSTTNYTTPDTRFLVITNIHSPVGNGVLYSKFNIIAPSAVTAAETKAITGSMVSGTYYYAVTEYSSITGYESDRSESVAVTVSAGDTGSVRLTSIPVGTKNFINQRKIYRSYVDDPSVFYLVTTITDNTTTVYTDNVNDTEITTKYSANANAEIYVGLCGYNAMNLHSSFLGSPIIESERAIISSNKDNVVINGYLAEVK